MTLNTARKIEMVVLWLTGALLLPVVLVLGLFNLISKILQWFFDMRQVLCHTIGNRLMLHSDAVKNGKIKDPYCLRNYTAMTAYKWLKSEVDT